MPHLFQNLGSRQLQRNAYIARSTTLCRQAPGHVPKWSPEKSWGGGFCLPSGWVLSVFFSEKGRVQKIGWIIDIFLMNWPSSDFPRLVNAESLFNSDFTAVILPLVTNVVNRIGGTTDPCIVINPISQDRKNERWKGDNWTTKHPENALLKYGRLLCFWDSIL